MTKPDSSVGFASDKCVLCKLSALKSLEFFDTLQTPPKTLGKRGLQAGQLAPPQRAARPPEPAPQPAEKARLAG